MQFNQNPLYLTKNQKIIAPLSKSFSFYLFKIIFFFVIGMNTIYSQERTVISDRSTSQSMLCEEPNYRFMINDSLFVSGKTIYYCPDMFPLVVTVVDLNKIPISDTGAVWTRDSKGGTINNSYGDHSQILISQDSFINDKGERVQFVKFEVKFKTSSGIDVPAMNLSVHLLVNNIIIDKEESEKHRYSFDRNEIKEYPYYGDGKPYKFLTKEQSDKVNLKSLKGKDATLTKMAKYKPITKFEFSPDESNELGLKYKGGLNQDSVYVFACDTIKLFKTDVFPEKELHVNIYTLAETDDDVANYCITDRTGDGKINAQDSTGYFMPDCKTRITSATHECILPGPDGSLDLFNSPTFWVNKDNNVNKDRDSFYYESIGKLHTRKIFAGSDKFCNEMPMANDTANHADITSKITIMTDSLNIVYNEVGIKVRLNYLGIKYFNFDSSEDNGKGKIAKIDNLSEQKFVHLQLFGGQNIDTMNYASTSTLFFVPEMIGVKGRATSGKINQSFQNIVNSCFYDAVTFTAKTIAHELGHARFGLFHPDGTHCIPKSNDNGYKYNGLEIPVISDTFNLMNSGCFPSGLILRRFQWKIIHSKI
jgi:hypothetical protein